MSPREAPRATSNDRLRRKQTRISSSFVPVALVYLVMSAVKTAALSSGKQGALIFLHGLGDSPAGWSALERQLPSLQPRLAGIRYVFPPAPTIGLSINGGMQMPGWFDLYDWPIGVGSEEDARGNAAAIRRMEDIVTDLVDKGIPRNKIVIGGFSQGGAIALLAAYGANAPPDRQPFAGCAALSGWITTKDKWQMTEGAKDTPLFWAHGTFDDKVLFEQQAHGVEMLREMGVKSIQDLQYRMGHESDPDEISKLAKFVDEMIFGRSLGPEL